MRRTLFALAGLLALTLNAPVASAQEGRNGYYRMPALGDGFVVFVSEGDLWRVSTDGGEARRLTSHPGDESHPAVSPDGTTLAYVASYEGPTEVYTMPVEGGRPVRQTFDGWTSSRRHTVAAWTPDGRVLVSTASHATLPNMQLVAIDTQTHERERVELFQAADGAYNDKASSLFFVRIAFNGSRTKRYEGGTIEQLWRFDGSGNEAVPLTTEFDGTSREPMWHNGRVYHLTDRSGFMNVWSCRPDGSDLKQHTEHTGFDVLEASEFDGTIAYRLGADIKLLNTRSGRTTDLDITLSSDFDHTREQWIDDPFGYLTWAEPSPDGDRVVLTARGEVFVAPVGPGRLIRVTRDPDVRYRQARFTPEGDELFVMSDESGEVEFWTMPTDGIGDERTQRTSDAELLLWRAQLSPDGEQIAYTDKQYRLFVRPIDGGAPTYIDEGDNWYTEEIVWSPDSRYIAYTINQNSNSHGRIGLFDTQTGERTDVTTLRYNSYSPAFHPDGEWLYLISERNFQSSVGSPWGPRQPEPVFDDPCLLYAIALQPGLRSPFLETNELVKAAEKAEAEAEDAADDEDAEVSDDTPDDDAELQSEEADNDGDAEDGDTEEEADEPEHPAIVTEAIADRLYTLPIPAGNYTGLIATETHLFWTSRPSYNGGPATLMSLEITNTPKNEPATVASGIDDYRVSADLSKLLIRKGNALYMESAGGGPASLDNDTRIDLSGWAFGFDPREQWRQMFTDSWRLMRDYFYDRGLHGLDWDEVYQRHLPLVDRVTDRQELADAIAQMVAELSALHTFVYGGDRRSGPDRYLPANLGCEAERDEDAGGYRITHLYRNDPEEPERAGPLMRHDLAVGIGDVITMIDGVSTLDATDLGELLRNKSGQQVLVRLQPEEGEAYDAIVYPISQGAASDLRYHEWEFTRRERVEELSGGKLGYVHLRAMGSGNIAEWARHYYGVFDRQGLIVDVRHNNGGNIDSWILNRLVRTAWSFWSGGEKSIGWNMQQAFRGHKAMLIDEETASDGEAVAEGFRRLGLGKLIGTRTWGGGIWLTSSNVLVDGGIATAAEFGVYGADGAWIIEGRGVSPDLWVDNLPHGAFHGADAQLDAAIDHLMELIDADPREVPQPPASKDLSWPRDDWPAMNQRP